MHKMMAWQQLFKVIWIGVRDPTCGEIYCLYFSLYRAQFHACFLSFEVAITQTRVYCLIYKDSRNICFPKLYSWSGHGAHVDREFRKEHLLFLSFWSMTPYCRISLLVFPKWLDHWTFKKEMFWSFYVSFV